MLARQMTYSIDIQFLRDCVRRRPQRTDYFPDHGASSSLRDSETGILLGLFFPLGVWLPQRNAAAAKAGADPVPQNILPPAAGVSLAQVGQKHTGRTPFP